MLKYSLVQSNVPKKLILQWELHLLGNGALDKVDIYVCKPSTM